MGDETTAGALEVDFLAIGVDLLDLYRGRLSFRRVCALVEHLPEDAAVWLINTQLALGKNLLLTPGVYDIGSSIRVWRPD
ncbi:hypothetical protein ACFQ1S_23030, partial [Kibdelosporangium lantanae]